jgi:hypothetical protein
VAEDRTTWLPIGWRVERLHTRCLDSFFRATAGGVASSREGEIEIEFGQVKASGERTPTAAQ